MCTCSKCIIPIFSVQFSKKYMISALSAENGIAEHVGPYFLDSRIGEIYCSVRYSMTMSTVYRFIKKIYCIYTYRAVIGFARPDASPRRQTLEKHMEHLSTKPRRHFSLQFSKLTNSVRNRIQLKFPIILPKFMALRLKTGVILQPGTYFLFFIGLAKLCCSLPHRSDEIFLSKTSFVTGGKSMCMSVSIKRLTSGYSASTSRQQHFVLNEAWSQHP